MKVKNQIIKRGLLLSLVDAIVLWGVILATHLLWTGIEIALYGEKQPSLEDTVMGAILWWSLYRNCQASTPVRAIKTVIILYTTTSVRITARWKEK